MMCLVVEAPAMVPAAWYETRVARPGNANVPNYFWLNREVKARRRVNSLQ
jgi:hypothetical protein